MWILLQLFTLILDGVLLQPHTQFKIHTANILGFEPIRAIQKNGKLHIFDDGGRTDVPS